MDQKQNPPASRSDNCQQAEMTLAYVETLATRFETTERRVNEDMERLEDRMNQLFELVRSVSTLQQQIATQQKTMVEQREAHKVSIQAVNDSIIKVEGKYVAGLAAVNKRVTEMQSEEETRDERFSKRVEHIENQIHTWVNRGVGAWLLFAALAGTFQYFGLRYINDREREREQLQQSVTKLVNRVTELENHNRMLDQMVINRSKPNAAQ